MDNICDDEILTPLYAATFLSASGSLTSCINYPLRALQLTILTLARPRCPRRVTTYCHLLASKICC
ncbi:hypothetical protein CCHR01_16288 [Colletotrichum chrysophilum]|uniref:Uncharacterized protein n=1 Tax=Colletotrichum chrysophilum TaxID=1836956 RepID=A0AAD9A623_9PEZI|nr:hypothetical protein CCHR01_16288 [Colletotrichum chrysophilum]